MNNIGMKERLLKELTDFFASLPDDAGEAPNGEGIQVAALKLGKDGESPIEEEAEGDEEAALMAKKLGMKG